MARALRAVPSRLFLGIPHVALQSCGVPVSGAKAGRLKHSVTESHSTRTIKGPVEAARAVLEEPPRWQVARGVWPAGRAGSHLLWPRRLRHHCGRRHSPLLGPPTRGCARPLARDLETPCGRCLFRTDLLYRELKQSACQVHSCKTLKLLRIFQ